jgi:RNA polymerase sigma factor (sigma-70 family)
LSEANQGQEESRDRIYGFLRNRLLSLARYRVQEGAEDLVQETLVVVHNHLAELASLDGLLAFTNQVLRNKIGNIYQGRARRRQREGQLQEYVEPGYRINDDLEANELEGILKRSIDKLRQTRPTCHAILSHLYNGFDVAEISDRLGIPKSKLKVRTFRCRQALRDLLSTDYGMQV